MNVASIKPMPYIQAFIDGVKDDALIDNNEIIGCTPAELATLNAKCNQRGIHLPTAYVDFLAFGGHQIGALLKHCDVGFEFCMKQVDSMANQTTRRFVFLQSYQDKFYFNLETPNSAQTTELADNPLVYYLDNAGNTTPEGLFSDFLLTHLGYYVDVRKRIPLATRRCLATTRQRLITLQTIYARHHDTAFYRSVSRVIELIDNLHNKGAQKINTANDDFLSYLDALAVKSKKTDFVTDAHCQTYISSAKDCFIKRISE